ncbi:MAG: 1-acyl-sn-glycerol-3-phosphate acyltransferase [Clostridia bacterium]|nr:1-acyl-sn-glycerol-3-phosphate acyltransferase [Clostridia bacterium]
MFYNFAKKVFLLIFKHFAHWKVYGIENIPEEGPAILAANHVSYWDPIVVGVASPRVVRFMAKNELFSILILRNIIKALNAFPVDRKKSDRAAIKSAIEVLKNGEVLGIFPEGTRIRDRRLGEFMNGVAMIALRSGAPIVPLALKNTRNIFSKGWFRSFEVHIGKPLSYPDLAQKKYGSQEIKKVTEDLRNAIEEML